MKRLIFLIMLIVFSACSINPVTICKARRNESLIASTAEIVLAKRLNRFEVKDISDTDLKARLDKLKCQWVVVSYSNHYYYPDSVVVFKRWGVPIAVVEIFYDFSMSTRNFAKEYGLKQITNRVYYRKRTWQLSYKKANQPIENLAEYKTHGGVSALTKSFAKFERHEF